VPRPATKTVKPPIDTSHTPAAGGESELAKLADTVKVTRDGFAFHVSYLTKFGEHRTEPLEKALESLQRMRAFKSHVSLQKTGIRIVVTTWDGEHFIEEPGIENLEHSSPDELQAVIRRNMHGASGEASPTMSGHGHAAGRQIVRLEVARKPHDTRFHCVLHRKDGTTETGLLLIRANLPKLLSEGLFRPEVNLVITAMNDRLIIERLEEVDGKQVKRAEAFDLKTDDDAKKLDVALNACLKKLSEPECL